MGVVKLAEEIDFTYDVHEMVRKRVRSHYYRPQETLENVLRIVEYKYTIWPVVFC